MKEWAHLTAALALSGLSIALLCITQTSDSVRSLDIARFYTMRREKGDSDTALNYLKDAQLWPSEQCLMATNLTLDPACMTKRVDIRNNILHHMKCDKYGSQTCSYLRLVLKALAYTSTTLRSVPANATSAFLVLGSNLKGKASNGETYNDILQNILRDSPQLFHGAYRAEQSDGTVILRSIMYNMIILSILGNLVMHIMDTWQREGGWERTLVRSITFFLIFCFSIASMVMEKGTVTIIMVINAAALVSLIYFEMFLDSTIVRPWIHPFVFTIIYMATCVLALIENGILDYSVIVVHLLTSMAASQMYMAMTWFFVGASEKFRLPMPKKLMYAAYQTKESQLALFGSIVLLVLIPLHQVLAPYNYTFNSVFLAISPVVFATLGMLTILVIQNLTLDDDTIDQQAVKLTPPATAITGSKIYSSMLLLLYGLVISMIFLSEHLATFRAYLDVMPDSSIQYDLNPNRKFLMGQGLTPVQSM